MAGSRLLDRLRSVDPDAAAAVLVGLGIVAVIRTTLLPGVSFWDEGEAQAALPLLGTMHPTGFPAYVLLGWLASIALRPLGSPALLMNLLSALLVGASVAGSVLVGRRLGAPLAVALAVAMAFGLTPIVWQIGNAADAHALHLALVVLVVLGLLRWGALVAERRERPGDDGLRRRADRAIVLTAAAFGLAVANHGLALLLIPPVVIYVVAVEPRVLLRPKLVLAAVGACLGVAALLYLELPVRAGVLRAPLVYGHPETWNGFWDVVLARQFQGSLVDPFSDLGGKASALLDLAGQQFGPLTPLIPLALLVTAVRHPRYALLSFAATAITCFFAASYANARIERYYLGPVFFAWTWVAAAAGALADLAVRRLHRPGGASDGALGEARDARPGGAGDAPPGGALGVLLPLVVGVALVAPTAADLDVRWQRVDRSTERTAATWLDATFASLAPDAVVISWWSVSTPMWYGQLVEGRRPDIWIVDDRTLLDIGDTNIRQVIEAELGKRPVYVLRQQVSEIMDLRDRYQVVSVGSPSNLYRVTGRKEPAP